MVHLQIAHGVHHDLFDEGLHPIVVVEGGGEDVGPDVLVHGGVLVQELLDGHAIDQHYLAPRLVLVADLVILQQTGEVLGVAPVSTGEGEEQMKGPDVLEPGVELELVLTPITAKVTTCLLPNEKI